FYYWGLNQYIMQRTLGAQSLAQGQQGIVFAAGMKLLIPFIIVMPGMMAFNLFSRDMRAEADKDNAPVLELVEQARTNAAAPLVVFNADAAWRTANPERARQLDALNQSVTNRAQAAGAKIEQEKKLI